MSGPSSGLVQLLLLAVVIPRAALTVPDSNSFIGLPVAGFTVLHGLVAGSS